MATATMEVSPLAAVARLAGKHLTFALGHETYGIPVLKVREIIRRGDITPLPQMPSYLKGILNEEHFHDIGKLILIDSQADRFGEALQLSHKNSVPLAKAEGENWVWGGATCLGPAYRRCLVSLSRGGADASVVREFDLTTKQFVKDGFVLPEAKSNVSWRDRDHVYVNDYDHVDVDVRGRSRSRRRRRSPTRARQRARARARTRRPARGRGR